MNEIDELKKKITTAEAVVKDITDEKIKIKAFEMALASLLRTNVVDKTEPYKNAVKGGGLELGHDVFDTSKLAKALNSDLDSVQRVIDFTEDDFHIISSIPGKAEGEKQRNATLILLAVTYFCKNEKDILASDLRKKLVDLGIGSPSNMSTNLTIDSFKNLVVSDGERGDRDAKYRITIPGIQQGLKLIHSLMDTNENRSEVDIGTWNKKNRRSGCKETGAL